jgi:hypothetical protein
MSRGKLSRRICGGEIVVEHGSVGKAPIEVRNWWFIAIGELVALSVNMRLYKALSREEISVLRLIGALWILLWLILMGLAELLFLLSGFQDVLDIHFPIIVIVPFALALWPAHRIVALLYPALSNAAETNAAKRLAKRASTPPA